MFRNIDTLIEHVQELLKKSNIILLSGPMGSGKTYFVKEYMKQIYNFDLVTSPTYTTCNTYQTKDIVKHFDFYIKYNPCELNIAIEDADIIFIEWWTNEMVLNHRCIEINCTTEEISFVNY